jgi:ubiquitin C-terminal hydrolase
MNTCLQCLVSIPELNYYFEKKKYKKEKLSNKSLIACEAMKEFVEIYNTSTTSSFTAPSSMYDVCHSFLPKNQQHDSHVNNCFYSLGVFN